MRTTTADYGRWLETHEWKWFCTLTFRDHPPKPHTALRKYKRWLERNPLFLPDNPYSFVATENGDLFGRLHLHSLVGGDSPGDMGEAWRDWFNDPFGGRAQIVEYEKEKGAEYYLAKYVTKELGEWEAVGGWPIVA